MSDADWVTRTGANELFSLISASVKFSAPRMSDISEDFMRELELLCESIVQDVLEGLTNQLNASVIDVPMHTPRPFREPVVVSMCGIRAELSINLTPRTGFSIDTDSLRFLVYAKVLQGVAARLEIAIVREYKDTYYRSTRDECEA